MQRLFALTFAVNLLWTGLACASIQLPNSLSPEDAGLLQQFYALPAAGQQAIETYLVQHGYYERVGFDTQFVVSEEHHDVWRSAFSGSDPQVSLLQEGNGPLLADGNSDSMIGMEDYLVWRHFRGKQMSLAELLPLGQAAGGGVAHNPEPTAVLVWGGLTAFASLVLRRSRIAGA